MNLSFKSVFLVLGLAIDLTHGNISINSLAQDVKNVESIREIKDVQRYFGQLAQFGRWTEMASLFSENGTLVWGNQTATGQLSIERWLKADAGKMDGIRPGSLDTMIIETPVVTLSVDGLSAKARWNGLRFQGDGSGGTKIQGGIYVNDYKYVLSGGKRRWKIYKLHYYPHYAGPYIGGWRNVGGPLPLVPYHFTFKDAGLPILPPIGEAPATAATLGTLFSRIQRLNDEDEVRNLQHTYGYYVDRRMWTDVVELFVPDGSVQIEGVGTYSGHTGVRRAMERMGPEGLSQGILNDHPNFNTIIQIDQNSKEATSLGIEVGMIGDANTRAASWEFNVYRNRFVKEDGLWKLHEVKLFPLIIANYSTGWGDGSITSRGKAIPKFPDLSIARSQPQERDGVNLDLIDLQRRLNRSAAFDGTENISSAYGYFADDIQCDQFAGLHANKGHKASPFAGFFQTPRRIAEACYTVYGTNRSTLRSSVSYHWRPQPVILVSPDGRSASLRTRLLQPSTSISSAGSFNGAMYQDQTVLEDGRWKLWSITIDEFYWQSTNWTGGWSAVNPRNKSEPNPGPSSWIKDYPPDITLFDVGDREAGFRGASGQFIQWPEIQRMWFGFRNPVSGRLPEYYWPQCVPCVAKPDWALSANNYQEPPTGPDVF